jgi:KDO2-lipid IV(A) lauroyltransferase
MAEFILGHPLRHVARRHTWLRQLLWRIDFGLVWLLIRFFHALPVDSASRLGARFGGWIGPLLRHKTRLFHDNLRIALPELTQAQRDAIVREAWRRGGRILAEYPQIPRMHRGPSRIEIVDAGFDPLRDGQCIFVMGHLGSWEAPPLLLMAQLGRPFAALYAPPSNPLLERMLVDSRAALGCQLLSREHSVRGMTRVLREGRSLGVVVDRRVDGGTPIRFFGHDKPSTLLPAKLALRSGLPLVPLRARRIRDAHFRVTLCKPVRPRDTGAAQDEQARDMMQQVHDLLERWIREDPADWFCSKRLWPKATLSTGSSSPPSTGEA